MPQFLKLDIKHNTEINFNTSTLLFYLEIILRK